MANKKKYNWFVLADILLASGDELNLNLTKFQFFVVLITLFSRQAFCHFQKYFKKKIVNTSVFYSATFSPQNVPGLDAGLDRKI